MTTDVPASEQKDPRLDPRLSNVGQVGVEALDLPMYTTRCYPQVGFVVVKDDAVWKVMVWKPRP